MERGQFWGCMKELDTPKCLTKIGAKFELMKWKRKCILEEIEI